MVVLMLSLHNPNSYRLILLGSDKGHPDLIPHSLSAQCFLFVTFRANMCMHASVLQLGCMMPVQNKIARKPVPNIYSCE